MEQDPAGATLQRGFFPIGGLRLILAAGHSPDANSLTCSAPVRRFWRASVLVAWSTNPNDMPTCCIAVSDWIFPHAAALPLFPTFS